MIRAISYSALLLAFAASAAATPRPVPGGTKTMPAAAKPVTANIINAEGKTVGTVTLAEADHGVKVTLDIKSLPPGAHLMHIHQNAKCDPPDFKSAGPHFDPTGMGHGEHGPAAMPAGDIPNFVLNVKEDGTAHTSAVAPNVTMGTDKYSVFSNGGTAIVIHAVADKVTEAAPPRIACAVITKPE